MSDYLDYLDEIYEELVDEFGHEIESNCIHEWSAKCDFYHTTRRLIIWEMAIWICNPRKILVKLLP